MPRPRRFTDDQVLDAARDLLADPKILRPTIAEISRQAGIHTGSIYLRFASRDELLARLWLRSIRRFHVGLIELLDGQEPLLEGALHQPRYCRAHPTEARAMKMFHRDQLLGIGPDELQDDLVHVNDAMNEAFARAVESVYGSPEPELLAWVYTAVKAIPYGLIRDFIARAQPIPEWIDDMVRAAVAAALDLKPAVTESEPSGGDGVQAV